MIKNFNNKISCYAIASQNKNIGIKFSSTQIQISFIINFNPDKWLGGMYVIKNLIFCIKENVLVWSSSICG